MEENLLIGKEQLWRVTLMRIPCVWSGVFDLFYFFLLFVGIVNYPQLKRKGEGTVKVQRIVQKCRGKQPQDQ